MKYKYSFAGAALLVWIIFIFCRSLKPAEISDLESQWVLGLLRELFPLELPVQVIRKLAHFTEFAILGALAELLSGRRRGTTLTGLWFSLITGIVIALCDETIQLFVPGRTGRVPDVWLDITGAFAGAAVILVGRAAIGRVRRKRKRDGPLV